jgi:hypothetical protein
LHPDIVNGVLARLRRAPEADSIVAAGWRRLADSWARRPSTYRNSFDLAEAVKRDGWSLQALLALEELLRPIVKVGRGFSIGRRAPLGRVSRRNELVYVEIEHQHLAEPLTLPDGILPQALDIMRRALERGQDLITNELGYNAYPIPPISADPDLVGGGHDQTHGIAPLFFQYLDAFRRLMVLDCKAANLERLRWRADDDAFDRLRIWAAGCANVTDGATAADYLLGLNDDSFWQSRHQRDLLLALRDRWTHFPARERRLLEHRLLRGRPKWISEDRDTYLRGRAASALERLIWLGGEGRALSARAQSALAHLQNTCDYDPKYARGAAQSLESRGGTVRTITDPGELLNVPPARLLNAARELSSRREWAELTERRPLLGLAEARPVRLIAALRMAEDGGEFPTWAWGILLSANAPSLSRRRGRVLVAERLARLAPSDLGSLIHDATRWFEEATPVLAADAPAIYDRLWLALVNTLRVLPDAAQSSVRSTKPDWVTRALNAPTGRLAVALMGHPVHQPADGQRFDPAWLRKITDLLELPDDGGRLAAVILLRNLHWFFHHDAPWTEARLLALRRGGAQDRAAFWSGFLSSASVPARPLYNILKPDMLHLVDQDYEESGRTDQLAGFILAGWMTPEDLGGPCVTDIELRDVLVAGSDRFRRHALWQLGRWLHQDGDRKGVEARILWLLQRVWPQQRVARNSKTSEALAELALGARDNFTAFADAVAPHLRPIEDRFNTLFAFNAAEAELVERHSASVLTLVFPLLGERSSDWPYDAKALVDRLAASPELARDPRLAELRRRARAG